MNFIESIKNRAKKEKYKKQGKTKNKNNSAS